MGGYPWRAQHGSHGKRVIYFRNSRKKGQEKLPKRSWSMGWGDVR